MASVCSRVNPLYYHAVLPLTVPAPEIPCPRPHRPTIQGPVFEPCLAYLYSLCSYQCITVSQLDKKCELTAWESSQVGWRRNTLLLGPIPVAPALLAPGPVWGTDRSNHASQPKFTSSGLKGNVATGRRDWN